MCTELLNLIMTISVNLTWEHFVPNIKIILLIGQDVINVLLVEIFAPDILLLFFSSHTLLIKYTFTKGGKY